MTAVGRTVRGIAAALAAGAAAAAYGPARAQPGPAASPIAGAWSGEYVCNQGLTAITLTISRSDPSDVRALFHFYAAPSNPGVPTGCFDMSGTYDPASGRLVLKGGNWLLRPPNYYVVDFVGQIDPATGRFTGRAEGPGCTVFSLSRRGSPRSTPRACRPPDDTVASLAPQ